MLKNIFSLKKNVIIITGANGLLGRKHAEAVAFYGGIPILLDLIEDDVKKFSSYLKKKYNVKSEGYAVDITKEELVEENSKLVKDKFGKIDGLVNNAANNPMLEKKDNTKIDNNDLENFNLDLWNKDISVGLTGSFLCSKHYGFQISKNPKGGVIVNISSDLGIIAPDQRLYMSANNKKNYVKPITYSVVKTGLIGLTRYLSTYWADKNVRCNVLCPGGVENGQSKQFLNKIKTRIPLQRLAKSNEYQGTLVWMLSDAASYLNGAIVPVEGGRTVW